MALRLTGHRKTTAEYWLGGKRVVMLIDRCHLCGVYGYCANKIVGSETAHADLTLRQLPAMIVRKTDAVGREYDPTCVECIDNRMYPDNKPKEAKK